MYLVDVYALYSKLSTYVSIILVHCEVAFAQVCPSIVNVTLYKYAELFTTAELFLHFVVKDCFYIVRESLSSGGRPQHVFQGSVHTEGHHVAPPGFEMVCMKWA